MYISIQIVASITERIASLLTVAETDELIVSVSTIVPSFIGYLAVTAFSIASLCSSERSDVLKETCVESATFCC